MFQSFTGSSRRPRQVNLSGRSTNNPFAASQAGRHAPHGYGVQNTLAIAQQERIARQQERIRTGAARTLQRTWRGYRSRKGTHAIWRAEWDAVEDKRLGRHVPFDDEDALSRDPSCASPPSYLSLQECLSQLRLLLHFFEVNRVADAVRLVYFTNAFQRTVQNASSLETEGEWTLLLFRLASTVLRLLRFLANTSRSNTIPAEPLLQSLRMLVGLIPRQVTRIASDYFAVMAVLTSNIQTLSAKLRYTVDELVATVIAPLQHITADTIGAYEWFGREYLIVPDLPSYLGSLDKLASNVNYKLLTKGLDNYVSSHTLSSATKPDEMKAEEVERRLWVLAYFIFFRRHALSGSISYDALEPDFVKVVSCLLNSVALQVSRRLEPDENIEEHTQDQTPLPAFVRDQIKSLVNQRSITGLLSKVTVDTWAATADQESTDEAKILAGYALTLLRVFPRRGDDIRMWLYLGSAGAARPSHGSSASRIPAIKYFWQASRRTSIFNKICADPNAVLPLLKPVPAEGANGNTDHLAESRGREEEWTIILLFLELYTFVLKVTDDDEFFAGDSVAVASGSDVSWTKESALPLKDVKDMTIFLKNLAFTLYWNAAELNETPNPEDTTAIRNYFAPSAEPSESVKSVKELEQKNREKGLPGVTGIPLDYFKGLVTGLLRMIHEREYVHLLLFAAVFLEALLTLNPSSRRKFLPDGHWLMTDQFDMEGFIPAVVAEEENRHQLQDDEDEDPDAMMDDLVPDPGPGLVGTSRVQQARRIEFLRRRQQQAARRKQLEAIAPRLEILRNMPFFIPFSTRVQIFREFIYRDQMRRRNGYIDPDSWRMSVSASMGRMFDGGANDILSRHHADIRRGRVFEDAFEQFYQLGDGLKEPIHISFIDQFGAPEAGIDGGGVTKEFLTSVANEALKEPKGLPLFVANDQNLLYPNPTAIEQQKELLKEAGIAPNSPEWTHQIRSLLRRYEFLGRVIGKCLYEGILVDVHFAPFFLLKWALTGGSGSAQKESSYRANLNDLRDLDESLYQGLVSSLFFFVSHCCLLLTRAAATQKLPRRRGRLCAELHRNRHNRSSRVQATHNHPRVETKRLEHSRNEPKPSRLHLLHCPPPAPDATVRADARIPAGPGPDHSTFMAIHVQSGRAADARRWRLRRDRRGRSPTQHPLRRPVHHRGRQRRTPHGQTLLGSHGEPFQRGPTEGAQVRHVHAARSATGLWPSQPTLQHPRRQRRPGPTTEYKYLRQFAQTTQVLECQGST